MSDMRRILPVLMLLSGLAVAGCAAAPHDAVRHEAVRHEAVRHEAVRHEAVRPDATDQRVLLVGFSPNEQVRLTFEDRLHEALLERDVQAVPSHRHIPAYGAIDHTRILATAAAQDTGLILMVRRLAVEGAQQGARLPRDVDATNRAYRTLRDFLASEDQRTATPPPPGRQVVEVYGYVREGSGARLIWSGYSWVDFDGDLDRAIGETAELIATNMAQSRDAVRASQGVSP